MRGGWSFDVQEMVTTSFVLDFDHFRSGKPKPLDIASESRRHGVLAAGSYEVEVVSEAHETWRGPVTVRTGETTKLRVALTPTPTP